MHHFTIINLFVFIRFIENPKFHCYSMLFLSRFFFSKNITCGLFLSTFFYFLKISPGVLPTVTLKTVNLVSSWGFIYLVEVKMIFINHYNSIHQKIGWSQNDQILIMSKIMLIVFIAVSTYWSSWKLTHALHHRSCAGEKSSKQQNLK